MDSIHEIRRKAPLHYHWRAVNAHFAAYSLSHLSTTEAATLARANGYTGTPSIALHEAFLRDAALAIELMLKAIISLHIQHGTPHPHALNVPATHNLSRLWERAQLPNPSRERQLELLYLRQILVWAGRYPAPKTDREAEAETAEIEATRGEQPTQGGFKFRKLRVFGWKEFSDLYAILWAEFDRLYTR